MKRFHLHLHVENLDQSVGFYSKLFAAEPTRLEDDYAKWMLEDPPLNFAISQRGNNAVGIDHLGFQTDNPAELVALKARATAADMALLDEGETSCCYARSDKYWVTDPQGVAWEHFHTLANIPVFNDAAPRAAEAGGCCATAAVAPGATAIDGAASGCSPAAPSRARGKPIGMAVKGATACC